MTRSSSSTSVTGPGDLGESETGPRTPRFHSLTKSFLLLNGGGSCSSN
jgi:hypothetical protein